MKSFETVLYALFNPNISFKTKLINAVSMGPEETYYVANVSNVKPEKQIKIEGYIGKHMVYKRFLNDELNQNIFFNDISKPYFEKLYDQWIRNYLYNLDEDTKYARIRELRNYCLRIQFQEIKLEDRIQSVRYYEDFRYENVVKHFGSIPRAQFELSGYFFHAFDFANKLIEYLSVEEVNSIPLSRKNRFPGQNWKNHYKNEEDNKVQLKRLIPDVFPQPTDVKKFYDLLNNHSLPIKIDLNCNQPELKALLQNICDQPPFKFKRDKYEYFEGKITYLLYKKTKREQRVPLIPSALHSQGYDKSNESIQLIIKVANALK